MRIETTMNRKQLTIADVQTRDVLYYDPDLKKDCYVFCKDRDIDSLPALDDLKTIYKRDDKTQTFEANNIEEDRTISATMNIFNPIMLMSFRKHPLLLVTDNEELTGVVHFADYGKAIVSIYLYELFFEYEKALRRLLEKHGCGDEDMITYFKYKINKCKEQQTKNRYAGRIQEYGEKIEKKKRSLFEYFYFGDLIALVNHKKIAKLIDLSELRNMIMHAHELVNLDDQDARDYIYSFSSFTTFFNFALELHASYRLVKNRLTFPKSNG